MTPTRIKICGITSATDATAAVAAGVDAIGLVFHEDSPRAVDPQRATEIVAEVSPFVTVVGLFVDAPEETVDAVLTAVPLNLLQFHGEESADYCAHFGRPWIKALRVRAELDIAGACEVYRGARGVLLDTWREGVPGGTGMTFDWDLAPAGLPLPVILAGGLTPDNVAGAVRAVRPAAVDVSGGVEAAPGVKDAARIAQFVAAVRAADSTLDR